jgi:hypothetical protein
MGTVRRHLIALTFTSLLAMLLSGAVSTALVLYAVTRGAGLGNPLQIFLLPLTLAAVVGVVSLLLVTPYALLWERLLRRGWPGWLPVVIALAASVAALLILSDAVREVATGWQLMLRLLLAAMVLAGPAFVVYWPVLNAAPPGGSPPRRWAPAGEAVAVGSRRAAPSSSSLALPGTPALPGRAPGV